MAHSKIKTEGLDDTLNKRGFVHEPSTISLAFIDFAGHAKGPVLDIGSATGVATLPALERGAQVIAMDMEAQHLELLRRAAPTAHQARLTTVAGRFPADLAFPDASIGGVLISQVLGFLSGDEITAGFSKLFKCMATGARLFVINYTPYMSLTANFIPTYERRRLNGERWPGYVEELSRWCQDTDLLYNLPDSLNLMDPAVVTRELTIAGFTIEQCSFLGGDKVPKKFQLDGREWVGATAIKLR
jgi:hypothetical protein